MTQTELPPQDVLQKAIDDHAENNGGKANKYRLLEECRDENHPLHRYVVWDDGEAAEKYRLEQAATFIRAARIVTFLKESPSEPVLVKKFVYYPAEQGSYLPRDKAMVLPTVKSKFIADKVNTLRSWVTETIDVPELQDIRKALVKLLAKRSAE